ncbi:hypothetical protein [Nocardia sp. CY41]|uniref:hypothetical protein n=1 Tax=Nocardia sp. CY41 TaxID=2608686 RepID=UPI001358FB47|nr:hypothetical protein [Nocardia sp. CY41]
MTSRNRKRRSARMDSAALGRVTAAAQRDPGSPTAHSGFAARAAHALYPVVPAWIQWLYERNPTTARFVYQMCYPPIDEHGEIVGGWTAQQWWTADRMYWAEREARTVVRARRFHSGGIVFAHSPDLDDDDAFFAARDSGRAWTGHWYSRDPVDAPEWQS